MTDTNYEILKVVSYQNVLEEHRLLQTGEIEIVKLSNTGLSAANYLEENN